MTLRVRLQVLFSETTGGLLRLDGMLLAAAGADLPAGAPLSVVLRLPASSVVAAVVEATVGRWADDLGVVDLELVPSASTTRVVLTDGGSTVRLEVETAGTLTA